MFSVMLLAILFTVDISLRDVLLALFVWIWAFRLGSFLFIRVKKAGSDGRFDLMKKDFWWFFNDLDNPGIMGISYLGYGFGSYYF